MDFHEETIQNTPHTSLKVEEPRIDEMFDAFETLEMVEVEHDCYVDHPKKLVELFKEEKKFSVLTS